MRTIDIRSSIENFYSKELYAKRPTEPGWTQKRPNREKELLLRVKVIRLADGQRLKFFFSIPKPLSKRELSDLERRLTAVQKQIADFRKDEDRDIVQRERKLLRPRTQPRRKKRK